MNNREKLIALMVDHKLDRRQLAELVRVKRDVIDQWLVSGESRSHVEIPDMAIELLELKLGNSAVKTESS